MDINIVDKSQWEKTIEARVSREELNPDFEKKFLEYKKNMKLEGFRKGKVPMSMIKRIFGKEIEVLVAEDKISDIIKDISKENKLKPIAPAKVEEFSYDEKQGLKFKAVMEIVPQVEISNYKGLSLEKEIYQVGEEDIDLALENLRERHAVMNNVDEEAKIDHHLIADIQQLDETGLPLIGKKFENRYFQLSDDDENEELTQQLIGIRIGETRNVQLTSTKPGNKQQLDRYAMTVKEIKEKILPELDDEFAKDIGDFKSLEDLRTGVREDLRHQYDGEYNRLFKDKIIDELVKTNLFDLPETMIRNYLGMLMERLKKGSTRKIDEKKFEEDFRSDAIRNLKWMVIKDEICGLEHLDIPDADVESFINQLIENSPTNGLQIRNYYRDRENFEKLSDELLEDKVIALIREHASVKEKTVTRKDLQKESKIIH